MINRIIRNKNICILFTNSTNVGIVNPEEHGKWQIGYCSNGVRFLVIQPGKKLSEFPRNDICFELGIFYVRHLFCYIVVKWGSALPHVIRVPSTLHPFLSTRKSVSSAFHQPSIFLHPRVSALSASSAFYPFEVLT